MATAEGNSSFNLQAMQTPQGCGALTSTDTLVEFFNYYANTSLFALQTLRNHGRLENMKLLSVGALMPHLADYLALFDTVYHNTMAATYLPVAPEQCAATYIELRRDFFDLPRDLPIDCVISHATIHCFNDTRYGNVSAEQGWAKPYQVPAQLRSMCGQRRVPIIISVSVQHEEMLKNNNAHLSHEKLVRAFAESGFELKDFFFDHVCGGTPLRPEYLEPRFRRARTMPTPQSQQEWIAGNYYFL